MKNQKRKAKRRPVQIVMSPTDILFDCPLCRKSMVIDEGGAGKTIQCAGCHHEVIVPLRNQSSKKVSAEQLLAIQQKHLDGLQLVNQRLLELLKS